MPNPTLGAALHRDAMATDDLAWEIHDVAADGDLVVLHTTMRGRQTGDFVTYGSPLGVGAPPWAMTGAQT